MHAILSTTTALLEGLFFSPAGKEAAYLDPGSGSFILQLIIASAVGALFVLRGYWDKFLNLFRKRPSEHEAEQDEEKGGK